MVTRSLWRLTRAQQFLLARSLLLGCCLLPGACRADPAEDLAEAPKAAKPSPANGLARETSPYLLQHAHNPVDWYPWGEEALGRARRENRPIFLSIGYSSGHWCHVMERESFTDTEIATLMNQHFVCIKVDREERPDVDSIYMTAVQIALFWDDQAGGFYFTSADHESLIARGKRFMDGARPAGNSVAAENLM